MAAQIRAVGLGHESVPPPLSDSNCQKRLETKTGAWSLGESCRRYQSSVAIRSGESTSPVHVLRRGAGAAAASQSQNDGRPKKNTPGLRMNHACTSRPRKTSLTFWIGDGRADLRADEIIFLELLQRFQEPDDVPNGINTRVLCCHFLLVQGLH